jgi:hypothetical protein
LKVLAEGARKPMKTTKQVYESARVRNGDSEMVMEGDVKPEMRTSLSKEDLEQLRKIAGIN